MLLIIIQHLAIVVPSLGAIGLLIRQMFAMHRRKGEAPAPTTRGAVIRAISSAHGQRRQASQHSMLPIIHRVIRGLLSMGVRISILGPMMLLTVRGRTSGQPRTAAVDLYEHDGRRFLIATHGEGNWVRNLRAAGAGSLSLGRKHQPFTATELTPEAGGPIIKSVLAPILSSRGIRSSTLRDHLGITAWSPIADFVNVARSHPVFELEMTRNEKQGG